MPVRLRPFLIAVPLLMLCAPAMAQGPVGRGGPWAADADGDGQISRAEMTAHMERRFALMDQDGDGLVPAAAMQRMLGHDRPRGPDSGSDAGPKADRGRGGHGPGGGPGGPPPGGQGPDGPPHGGRRADAAGGPPPPPPGRAMPYPEDGNDDGQIDRMEFLAPALAMFDDQDRNGDGVLSVDELPPPPPRDGEGPPPEQ